MRTFKLVYVCTLIILLYGCDGITSKTEVSSSKNEKNEAVVLVNSGAQKSEEPKEVFQSQLIDTEMVFPSGQGQSDFTYYGKESFKISLFNTGTENFLFKIRNVEQGTIIANGVLQSTESFEQVFNEYPEGDYVISYVIQEEGNPSDIKLKIKVELLP